jgi:shikimate dehydrogenase
MVSFRLGLLGWPLEHSISPAIHIAALKAAGLKGEYRLFPCSGGPALISEPAFLLEQMRRRKLHGLNVTIPYKRTALEWVDILTPYASSIGAVNTIYYMDGRLVGDNTDGPGFLKDLTSPQARYPLIKPPVEGEQALILGAGGAARAAVAVLLGLGMNITAAAIKIHQAGALSEEMSNLLKSQALPTSIRAIALNAENLRQLSPAIIVNTTPLGMYPEVKESPWPSELPFPSKSVLYDMVYNPPETILVQAARASGLKSSGGMGMLVEQAALSFEIWTGQPASREAMYEAAKRSLPVISTTTNSTKKETS